MISNLKFGQDLAFARVLGGLMARALARNPRPQPECIVPLPLHRTRYVERGFNQSAEIAKHLARHCQIPLHPRLLQRVRATQAQSTLNAAERVMNLSGAFRLSPGQNVPRHVALLDDVLTTGSTASAAAQVLRAGGTRRVEIWACARTP
jgi:ComF family protein